MNFYSPRKKPNFLRSRETREREKKTYEFKMPHCWLCHWVQQCNQICEEKKNIFIRSNAAHNKIIYAQFFENQIFFTIQSV